MAYFDPGKQSELVVDFSPVGISTILLQREDKTDSRRVIAYASREPNSSGEAVFPNLARRVCNCVGM